MSRKAKNQLWVWLDDPAFGVLQHVGVISRGVKGTISFAYSSEWLEHARTFPLDPELDLYVGEFFSENMNFGVFMDSCPDRWGRKLMDRREALEAKEEGRARRTLTEWDYLLGVQDLTRMGALRYSYPEESIFQSDELLAAPPISKVGELQKISYQLTKTSQKDLAQVKRWLLALVAPGASLGGARPKANIVESDGQLWIAKFPSANDEHDVAAWEMTLHLLAQEAGLRVAPARLLRFGDSYQTFVTERFDRDGHRRLFFVSAMTMLKKTDKEDASYLELADFIATYGHPDFIRENLKELFCRVVFNAMTANRDDHLRNHGFIRTPDGWVLSPAYDMNPSFRKEEHELTFDGGVARPNIDIILDSAEYYFLRRDDALNIVQDIAGVVSSWEKKAQRCGLSAVDRAEAEGLFDTFGMTR